MQHKITIQFQDELVTVEPVVMDGNVQFRVNFGQPVYLEKELGELIDRHPELI